MSIIYNALKKIEEINAIPKINKSNKPKVYLVYILGACLGFLIASIFLGFLKKLIRMDDKFEKVIDITSSQQISPKDISIINPNASVIHQTPKEKSKKSLALNGVFFSENEGYTVINNRILKEGDVIDGATVKRITLDEVELEYEGSIITLYAK